MSRGNGDRDPGAPGGAGEALRSAWDRMLAELGRAREAIDDPRLYPPPPTDRNLAEGYRYLLGFLFGVIDRALTDPDFPRFRRAIQPLDKGTIDNADALYLSTGIDPDGTYLVLGRAGEHHHHWTGERVPGAGRMAPQYVIFEATTAYAGDSGSLAELSPRVRTNTGRLDSSQLRVEPDGTFEILLAPARPEGYRGNFIPTRRTGAFTGPDGASEPVDHAARYLVTRELFYDWEREDALELRITRQGFEGAHPTPLDPARAGEQMSRIGELVGNQMRFWNEFYAVVLETYGDMNGDGKRFMPRNDLNPPSAASIQTGGGQSTNIYSGGVYEIDESQALIVETRTPAPPAYLGFHLSNLWGESLDYANHTSSLNGFQAEPDADGALRYVIAHRDPGVPNWLDTTGLPEGFMALRYTYSEKPGLLPTVKVTKVAFDEIRSHLPAGVRTVTGAERREQIRIRQEHVQRRYRQY